MSGDIATLPFPIQRNFVQCLSCDIELARKFCNNTFTMAEHYKNVINIYYFHFRGDVNIFFADIISEEEQDAEQDGDQDGDKDGDQDGDQDGDTASARAVLPAKWQRTLQMYADEIPEVHTRNNHQCVSRGAWPWQCTHRTDP